MNVSCLYPTQYSLHTMFTCSSNILLQNDTIALSIKADRPLTRDTLNAPWLPTNRQFQWSSNGHSQLPLAELGKPT